MRDCSENAILVGMCASLSGDFHVQGTQALHGVIAWIRDVNRDGGIFVKDRDDRLPVSLIPVSYTHLTLPTSDLV